MEYIFLSCRSFSFTGLVFELINIHILDLILWSVNMHCTRLIVIWLIPSFRKIFITFIIREKFAIIRGGNIRQSVLIKILSILNIFYITGKSLFLITIVKLIEPIIFFVNYEGSFVETERHIYYRSNILFLWCLVVSMPLRRRLIFKWILLFSFTSISFFCV